MTFSNWLTRKLTIMKLWKRRIIRLMWQIEDSERGKEIKIQATTQKITKIYSNLHLKIENLKLACGSTPRIPSISGWKLRWRISEITKFTFTTMVGVPDGTNGLKYRPTELQFFVLILFRTQRQITYHLYLISCQIRTNAFHNSNTLSTICPRR